MGEVDIEFLETACIKNGGKSKTNRVPGASRWRGAHQTLPSRLNLTTNKTVLMIDNSNAVLAPATTKPF